MHLREKLLDSLVGRSDVNLLNIRPREVTAIYEDVLYRLSGGGDSFLGPVGVLVKRERVSSALLPARGRDPDVVEHTRKCRQVLAASGSGATMVVVLHSSWRLGEAYDVETSMTIRSRRLPAGRGDTGHDRMDLQPRADQVTTLIIVSEIVSRHASLWGTRTLKATA